MMRSSWSRRRPIFLLGAIVLSLLSLVPLPAGAQLNATGQWSTLPYQVPINPIHVAVLKNGKVLIVAGSENNENTTVYKTAVWDPAAGSFSQQTTPWDLFCNGMTHLPDGRVIIVGGNTRYDPFYGPPWTTIFDPATETFYRVEDMAKGRWYPTTSPLNDGGTMVFGGLDEQGVTNTTTEIYDVGGGWTGPYPASFSPGWYPRLHLLGNGKVFMSGPGATSKTFDPAQGTWSSGGNTTIYGQDRLYGSSVLLPLDPNDGYKPKVVIFGGNTHGATNTVELIDLGTTTEFWVSMPPMSVPRVTMNAVLLPNGKILTLGGSTNFNDPATAHKNAETFDPVAQTWTPSGTGAYNRLYHSSALLLPDGTVWVAGSNPNRSTWEPNMEIYKPPYLFTASGAPAPRPTITTAPAVVGYGQTFSVSTPNAAAISKVILMRPGSNTHAFDMEQRLVQMFFTQGSGTLSVTAPTSTGAAPPGHYMLFIIDANGVPSVAKFVQLSQNPTNQAPTAGITSPTSAVTVNAGQPVTFAGAASDPDGSIALYSWNFPGGSPKTSNAQNPGAVTFATPGVYTVSLTVLDNLGANNPSPPTLTVTVNGTATLGASISAPANGATVSGTVTVSMTATNIQGTPTQFLLKLDNATTLSNQSVPSGSTATYAWNTATTGNGNHTLNLTVVDGAGRTATAAVSVLVANSGGGGGGGTGPSVTITTPFNGDWIGNSVRIAATATSSGSALTSLKIYGNGGVVLQVPCSGTTCSLDDWWTTGLLPNAAYQIQAVATNAAGAWTTTSPPITLNKNQTSPIVPSGAPGSSGGGGGGGDTTPPTIAITAPAEGSTVSATVTVSATASDNVGVAGVQFKLDGANFGAEDTAAPFSISWNTTTAANGSHTLTAVARDAAGNVTTSTPITVVVSNGGGGGGGSAPSVTITTPMNGNWIGNSVRIAATATSSGPALTSLKIYGNGGVVLQVPCSGATCSLDDWWTTGPLPNAAYQIQAVATNAAGAWTTTSPPITLNKNQTSPIVPSGAPGSSGGGGGGGGGDTTAPTVAVSAPTAGATVTGTTTMSATAGDNVGVVGVQFKLDGANLGAEDTTAPYSIAWDTATATNGTHALTAVARDAAGNTTTSAAVSVTVSNGGGGGGGGSAPSVTITTPMNGNWIGNSVRIAATATSSGSALASLKIYGNGGVVLQVPCTGTTCTLDDWWSTSALPNAAYQIQAVATNAAGQSTISSPPITLNKNQTSPVVPSGATTGGGGADTTAPTVSITAPAGGATVSGGVTVTATASDNVGVAGVQFTLDGADLGTEDTGSPYTVVWDTTMTTNGTHTLTALARDAAGNTTTSATVTVFVSNGGGGTDSTPPAVSISTPHNGDWTGNSIRVTATATDNLGVATLKLYGNGVQFGQTVVCNGTPSCTFDDWWSTGALPSGQHTIVAVATDTTGNQTSSAPITINK